MGNDGYNKILFSVSSGLSKDGWAFTLLGGKTWGDGYIQGTEFEGYNWFASVAKRFNDNHQLSLTAFGAPQWHNQRNNQNGLTIKEWQRVKQYMGEDSPYKYNPTFGYRNGQVFNSSRNSYHKPQISLNHLWQIDRKSSLSTALYVSIGRGTCMLRVTSDRPAQLDQYTFWFSIPFMGTPLIIMATFSLEKPRIRVCASP